ncbi:MMPL family transporter [Geodermatophilus sp. URMC 61]|uniref:MMPL family transporter n=1 Tax=Geodermatophilus sp. URMC 61 TaxID=3423411 RepID=UPI00406CBBC1
MIERFSAFTRRTRWPIAVVWVLLVAGGAFLASGLPDRLSGGGWDVDGSQSAAVEEALREGFVGRGESTLTVVVHDREHTADEEPFEGRVREVVAAVAEDPDLEVRSTYGWSTLSPEARGPFLGGDRRTVVNVVGLGVEDGYARQELPAAQERLHERFADDGLEVSLVGPASFWGEVNELSEEGLFRAELITLPLIVLVVVLLFGGIVAALVALVVGVTSIVLTLAVLSLLAGQYELSLFVQNTATMLGLGVGVDYSLFVIARFKEELAAGRDVESAIATTLRTSGETVLSSGVTVIAAMCTLFLVPLGVIGSIALGAVVVVAFSVFTSVVLLPVLLHLLGPRIDRWVVVVRKGTHRRPAAARWAAFAGRVMRRPVAFLVVTVAGLLLLAAPSLGLRTFTPDARIIPAEEPVRAGYTLMEEQFGVGSTAPLQVLVSSPEPLGSDDGPAVTDLRRRLQELPGVVRVDSALDALAAASPEDPLGALAAPVREALPPDARQTVDHSVSADGRRLLLSVVPDGTAAAEGTQELLDDVRAEAARTEGAGLSVDVGGETAQGVDSNDAITRTMPAVVAAMLGVIYLFLLVTFRSVFLPLKAILINLLSVAATYGVLVLVFQHGIGADLLGFERTGYVQNFVPVLLLTLLFSLSTDYEVFLLSRVREDHRRTGDGVGSVARGLARTAPLISGAALLMVVVFGAFSFAGILPMKQLGLGMAVAIALDATVIRLVVVPASMRLMGDWNWWMPGRRAPARRAAGRGRRSHPAAAPAQVHRAVPAGVAAT